MKRKKIVAVLVTLVYIIGMVSTGIAAPVYNDVEGTKYEDSVIKLTALDIITGYPDGTFKPDNTITRAEFSTIAVRLLGLEIAAVLSQGSTQYNDVDGDHWASGYINIATNRDIIKGYPDGTFRPSKEVTYAEALTMIVRVLGYGPATEEQGNWPANYISKAAELDLIDDLRFTGNNPAPRGDIALIADNSLDVDLMERVGFGDEATYEIKKGKTLLSDKLDVNEIEGRVVEIERLDSRLKSNEIRIRTEDGTEKFELLTPHNPEYLLGLEVTILESDDKILNLVIESEYYFDALEDVTEDELTLVQEDTDFDISEDARAYVNGSSTRLRNLESEYDYAKVVLDDNDDVIFIDAYKWDGYIIVEDVNTRDEEILGFEGEIYLTTLDYEDYTIVKNGKSIEPEDIKEFDILFYTESGDGYAEVFNWTVRGRIDEVFRDEFEVDGEIYEYVNDIEGNAKYLDEDEEIANFGHDEAEQMMDEGNVTVYLSRAGQVVFVDGELGELETDTFGALLYEDTEGWHDPRNRSFIELLMITEEDEEIIYEIRLDRLDEIKVDETVYEAGEDEPISENFEIDQFVVSSNGEYIYAVDEDFDTRNDSHWTYLNGSANISSPFKASLVTTIGNLAKGDVIEIEMNDRGNIVGLTAYTDGAGGLKEQFGPNEGIELDDRTIGGKLITSNMIVFFAEGSDWDEDDVTVERWRDMDEIVIDEGWIYFDEDHEIKYMVIKDSDYEDTTDYQGVVTSINRNSDGDIVRVTILIDGTEETIRFDDAWDDSSDQITEGKTVTITLDDATGRATEIKTPESNILRVIKGEDISAINPSSRRIEIKPGSTDAIQNITLHSWYQLMSRGNIYDATDPDDLESISFAQLRRLFNDDEIHSIEAVLIADGSRYAEVFRITTEESDDTTEYEEFDLVSINATEATITGFVYDDINMDNNKFLLRIGDNIYSSILSLNSDIEKDDEVVFTGFDVEKNGVYKVELYRRYEIDEPLNEWNRYIQGSQ